MVGPNELRFIQKTSWWQLLDAGRRHGTAQPFSVLAETVLMLGSHARRPTRDDGSTPLRVAAEDLRSMLISAQRLDAASSNDLLADRFPRFLAEAFQAMPESLRTGGVDPVEHRDDLRDGLVLAGGRPAEVQTVYWRRLHDNLTEFYALSAFSPLIASPAVLRVEMGRLITHFTKGGHSTPAEGMEELERVLKERGRRGEIDDQGQGLASCETAIHSVPWQGVSQKYVGPRLVVTASRAVRPRVA